MKKRLLFFAVVLPALIGLPFVLRRGKTDAPFPARETDTLVVITPHNKAMRDEYERAFRKYYRQLRGRDVRLDFRNLGGTSDIVRYIADRYETEFRRYYTARGNAWTPEVARGFSDAQSDRPDAPDAARAARRAFLESDVGIGIDVMAGGGAFESERNARRGFIVPGNLEKRHPEYFRHIPYEFGGTRLCDPEGRYYSVVLSTFGIVANTDRLREMNAPVPRRWSDLAGPEFFGKISVANPTKSGSVAKCFEIMIQQTMNEASSPGKGWTDGINRIKRIFANSRSCRDSAAALVREVADGDSVAGIAIDTYAISEMEYQKKVSGNRSVIVYRMPEAGTAVSGDTVQILRGAPHRKVADDFLDFLFSREGQQLHCYRAGTPGGPEKYAFNRAPVRRDLYDDGYRRYAFDPDCNPYLSGADFVYRDERTARFYVLIRQTIKLLMLDCRTELAAAYRAIIEAGGAEKVPLAAAAFDALPFSYDQADHAAESLKLSSVNDAVRVAQTMREWSDFARRHYKLAEKLAKEGK